MHVEVMASNLSEASPEENHLPPQGKLLTLLLCHRSLVASLTASAKQISQSDVCHSHTKSHSIAQVCVGQRASYRSLVICSRWLIKYHIAACDLDLQTRGLLRLCMISR